jgi:phosphoenolpyruvate carboxykinase (GTP)
MAMLPFCGYNMGLYLNHWLRIGKQLKERPRIFHVNWFRKGADGKFLWPGYGENMRVLEWIVQRARGQGGAIETPIGWMPRPGEIDLKGLDCDPQQLAAAQAISADEWKQELVSQTEWYLKLSADMPRELIFQRELLVSRLF